MKLVWILSGLFITLNTVQSRTIVKRESGDITPLNEKIDSLLDAKTKALGVLDESNKAKNAIYGIDPNQSATGAFISDILGKKLQASTAGIGPLINSATTFISSKGQGLFGALTSKIGPLSSLSGGLSGGSGGDNSGGGGGSGGILSLLTSLSGSSSSGLSGGSGGKSNGDDDNGIKEHSSDSSAGAGGGITLGSFPSVGGGPTPAESEDIPEFDRERVSLAVPAEAFGTGFNIVTGITKILNKFILNSAHRAESVLEVFKPIFRGAFAIKGLPSDKNNNNNNIDNHLKLR
ncbi:keratin, type I cytoskeletal 9-like isoform X2 [Chelonus insularis]|uniref:keratin, type I cytoskeletal 9-like isoform X2 n=1 Tax=Chelonus insularis TaxID=460826 RepID=UPI00158AF2B5|nr:keratin, type I cytoskeletal 9-like isoform X2 [Chelonus insularis]